MLNVLRDSTLRVFNDVKTLKNVDDLSEFFESAMLEAISDGIDELASCILEAGIFVSLEITEYTSTFCAGVRFSLFVDSDFVREGLKYLVGELSSILLNIENPFGIRPAEVFADHMYLGVSIYTGLTCPWFIKNLHLYPLTKIGIQFNANLASMCRLISWDLGNWKVTAGVIITEIPTILVPAQLNPDSKLESDLWLLKVEFSSAR
jgi:hypothetical protein